MGTLGSKYTHMDTWTLRVRFWVRFGNLDLWLGVLSFKAQVLQYLYLMTPQIYCKVLKTKGLLV